MREKMGRDRVLFHKNGLGPIFRRLEPTHSLAQCPLCGRAEERFTPSPGAKAEYVRTLSCSKASDIEMSRPSPRNSFPL